MHSDRKGLRDKASAKAKRLASASSGKVDASSWTPESTPTSTDVQTGMKPISRRAFKRGGKVAAMEGAKAKANLGSKPRKAGHSPTTPVSMANRDMKQANASRPGPKVVGAMKRGGKAHDDVAEDKKLIKSMVKPGAMKTSATKKADGGSAQDPYAENEGAGAVTNDAPPKPKQKPAGHADGGKVLTTKKNKDGSQQYVKGDTSYDREKTIQKSKGAAFDRLWSSDDPAEKEKMRGAMTKMDFADLDNDGYKRGGKAHGKDCNCKKCSGGRVRKAGGGGFDTEDALKTAGTVGAMGGGLLPMGIAAAIAGKKKRNGGAAGHGKDCDCKKCCGGGRIGRKSGGKVGTTNINIVIGKPKTDEAPAGGPPMVPPVGLRPPMGPPPAGAGAPPPALLAALAARAGSPSGAPAGGPMPRPPGAFKRGGKVYSSAKDMDAGAGSGEGRIEKSEIAAKSHR